LDDLLPDSGELTEEERQQLFATDLIVRGLSPEDRTEVYLAVEVSVLVEPHDVRRALDRALLLEKATGKKGLAVVAGERITDEAQDLALENGVWCVLDGSTTPPTAPATATGAESLN
jgi:hypothetical protein